MADGSVRRIVDGDLTRESLSRLIGCDDGVLDWDKEPITARAQRKLKVGDCIRLGFWIVVVLLPLPWVWLNPRGHAASGRQ